MPQLIAGLIFLILINLPHYNISNPTSSVPAVYTIESVTRYKLLHAENTKSPFMSL